MAVSLTSEQALVDYDPNRIDPDRLLGTLRDLGYQLYDPRKGGCLRRRRRSGRPAVILLCNAACGNPDIAADNVVVGRARAEQVIAAAPVLPGPGGRASRRGRSDPL